MPLDPSIIPAQQKIPNFGEVGNTALGLVGMMQRGQQLKALQQQMAANQAASGAIQANTDQTGAVNIPGVIKMLSQNPQAAYNLPQIANQLYQMQGAKYGAQNQQLEAQQRQLNYWDGQLGGLRALGSKVTKQDVIQSLATGVANGMVSPQQAAIEAQSIPNDPAELPGYIQNHWISLQDAKTQGALTLPQNLTVNTGGQTVLLNRNPLTGQSQEAGTLQNTLTPGEAAQRVPTFQNGQAGTVPLGSTVTGGANSGFLPTAPVLGQPDIAKAAADRYNALTQAAGQAPTAINGYDRALDALQRTTSGPGSSGLMDVTGVLNSLGLPVASDSTQNYQSLKKYLANAASQAAQASGYSGSDARFSAFEEGQPNAKTMNPAALGDAIRYVKALQMGVMAKNNAAQAYLQANGGNTATLPKFETEWSNTFSPDVMELRSLPPADQAKFIQGLSKSQKSALMKSYQGMASLGAW